MGAEHLGSVTHDEINRYLKTEKITPKTLWLNVQKALEVDEDGYLVFDDTVLDKRHSQKIELVRKQQARKCSSNNTRNWGSQLCLCQ